MFLLFDIGGTNTRLFLTEKDSDPEKLEPLIFPTPSSHKECIQNIKDFIDKSGVEVEKIVGGIAGVIDPKNGKILHSPNLPEWNNIEFAKEVKIETGIDTILENDAVMAGLGEASFGGGMDYSIVAYITVSTGIGGARIVNKMPDDKRYGFEPGHQLIKTDFTTGKQIELESLVSGKSIKRLYGNEPQDIHDNKIWDEIHYYIACGLHNTILFWSPDVIILGGSTAAHLNLEIINEHLKNSLKILPEIPEIRKSKLGHTNGLLGALYLLNKS